MLKHLCKLTLMNFNVQWVWTQFSCKHTLVVFHAPSSVAREGWTMVCYLWDMLQKDFQFWGLATNLTGSSRIRGGKTGEKMGITSSAEGMACVEWTQWFLLQWLLHHTLQLQPIMLPISYLLLLCTLANRNICILGDVYVPKKFTELTYTLTQGAMFCMCHIVVNLIRYNILVQ